MAFGDSKSAPDSQTWAYRFARALSGATGEAWRSIELGRGGYTVAATVNNLTASNDGQFATSIITAALTSCESSTNHLDHCELALRDQQPAYILLNLGVNDVGFDPPWVLPNHATWVSNFLAVVDALHAQWSEPLIYISIPWKRQPGGDESIFTTMATWIRNDIIAVRPFLREGDDETQWFAENADSLSSDPNGGRIHYNDEGSDAKVAALMVATGH